MKECARSFIIYKFVLNILFLAGQFVLSSVTYTQAWLAWFANFLLCIWARYKCEKIFDPIPLILAFTINPLNPSTNWLLAYTLYIIYFTSSIGIPILGLLGIIFPAMMMKNNGEYGRYRIIAVILSGIFLIQFNNSSKVF